ncbi:MAG TPA: nucleotidyltransferase family protein [Lachnospiraceae bacterium]|nr:nucleotidyltransferase family protein [Lachnospiraceae bacterium]
MMRLGIVLLAAGVGKRFGGNKLTAQVRGKPMYLWAMENIEEMKTELPIVVVTGTPEIVSAAEAKGMIAIFNGQPELGISLSIRLGIEAVIQEDRKVDGILFMVCDQPWLEKTTLVRLMSEFDGGILALSFGERRGNPVIFSREYLKELSELSGDIGGRQVMARHRENVRFLEVNDERELQDIDKREQMEVIERQEEI